MSNPIDSKRLFFPVFFPSLFLLAAMGAPGLDTWSHHREVFGSDNYYLTVLYSGSPDGVLSPGTPMRFSGSLVTETGEVRVRGVRRRQGDIYIYELAGPEGTTFVGELKVGACPQFMQLTPTSLELKTERLRAGVCL